MALTVLDAQGHIEHALGGPLVGISNRRVLDEAGRKLFALNDWNFLKRASTTLSLVSGQSYATLPSDFGEIITIEYTNGTAASVVQTTITEIAKFRSILYSIPGYVLFVTTIYTPDANGVPVARLEIYPTPGSDTTLTMFYRANWADLANSDQTFIPVPAWMESLYIQIVRATAWGYQDDTMSARVTSVMNGPEWYAAVRYDEALQWQHGPLMKGMLDNDGDNAWYLRTAALPPAAG